MNLPNLDRVVDTGVRVEGNTREALLSEIRREIIPLLRQLQGKGLINWYCFLLHPAEQMGKRSLPIGGVYIHLFLEPALGFDASELARNLPGSFLEIRPRRVSVIGGVEQSLLLDADWAQGWKMIGEASAWVVALLESHNEVDLPPQQVAQFIHFMTNPLGLGAML